MFYSTVLLAATAFSGLVSAQSGNSTVTVDPNSLTPALRQSFCRAQLQTCPQLCEDQRTTAGGNTCDANLLTYNCVCASDNKSPNVADYEQTLPGQVCRQYVIQCTAANPNDRDAQTACQATVCGNKTVEEAASSISSSQSTSSASTSTRSSGSAASETASPTSGGDEASSTASQSASSATGSSAASGLNIASTGALAVGILAAFGFAL